MISGYYGGVGQGNSNLVNRDSSTYAPQTDNRCHHGKKGGEQSSLQSQNLLKQLIPLLIQLLNLINKGDNSQPLTDPSSQQSAPSEPVRLARGTTIGQTSGPFPQVLDNSTIVDIGGQQYSIGALKLQADNYNQSNFVPQGGLTSFGVSTSWGFGNPIENAAFENYMSANFPNGLII